MITDDVGTQGEPTPSGSPARALRLEAMVFVGVILAIAIFVIATAGTIREPAGSASTLSARVTPYVVGALLLVSCAVVLLEQFRGHYGEAESGEDIDPNVGTSWSTVAILSASFASLLVTIPHLGWPLAVVVLFTGAALGLGGKSWWKAALIGACLGVATQVVFGYLLGLSLPITGTLTAWTGV